MMMTALTGCSSQTETTAAPTQGTQAETEGKTEAPTEAPTTAAPTTEAITTEAPTEEVTTAPAATEQAEEPTTEEVVELPLELTVPDYMVGGMPMIDDIEIESEDLDESGQKEVDRAVRAYKPSGSSLLINNAKEFYYYSQLSQEAQQLYDAMLMVAEDPTNTNCVVATIVSPDPSSEEFWKLLRTAYFCLLYDHAELFWLYNGIESDFMVRRPYVDSAPKGKHTVYLSLTTPYKNYKKEMNAFNDAVEAFLNDIDLTASDAEIAVAIHDKLVDQVTYNQKVYGENLFTDLGHTAYGALVADSSGTPHYAVCDGYSQAYVYLLQQAGINAALIIGLAGQNKVSAGGHAWSVVELDGEWYEVDSTWDDIGEREIMAEDLRKNNSASYVYYHDALSDEEYRDLIKHYLFNVTTDEITDFHPVEKHYFINRAIRASYSLVGDSVHIRSNPNMAGVGIYGLAIQYAPVATGTLHAYK